MPKLRVVEARICIGSGGFRRGDQGFVPPGCGGFWVSVCGTIVGNWGELSWESRLKGRDRMQSYEDWAQERADPRFTDWLRGLVEPVWEQAVSHRFTRELADGTLED